MVDERSHSFQSYLSDSSSFLEIRASAGVTKSCFKNLVRVLLALHGILLVPYLVGCVLGRVFDLELLITVISLLFWVSGIALAGVMIYSLDQSNAKCLCETFVAVQGLGIIFGLLDVLVHHAIELSMYQIEEHEYSASSGYSKGSLRVMTWDEMRTEDYYKISPVFARLRDCQEKYGNNTEFLNDCMKPVMHYNIVFYVCAIITIIYSSMTLLTACCGFCEIEKSSPAAMKAAPKSTPNCANHDVKTKSGQASGNSGPRPNAAEPSNIPNSPQKEQPLIPQPHFYQS